MRSLALAEIWYGDLAQARKFLDALLTLDVNPAETHHLSGLCDLRAAHAANDKVLFHKAKAGFTNAYRLDDRRAHSLFRYVECAQRELGAIDQHLLDSLGASLTLAPPNRRNLTHGRSGIDAAEAFRRGAQLTASG